MANCFDKKSFAFVTFGKRHKDLNEDERKEFEKLQKRISRSRKNKKKKEREYARKYYYKNRKRVLENSKRWREKNKDRIRQERFELREKEGYKIQRKSFVRILFNKKLSELNKEERREYVRTIAYLNKNNISKEKYLMEKGLV